MRYICYDKKLINGEKTYMLRLYFKKIIWIPVYIIAWLIITLLISLFLGMFFSPAFIAVFSFIGIIILITAITFKTRYNNNATKREYLIITKSFKIKSEILKVLHTKDFIADLLVFVTFALILVIISALKLISQTNIIIWLLATFIVIFFTTILLSTIDIAYWLLIRYRWYKEKIENKNY